MKASTGWGKCRTAQQARHKRLTIDVGSFVVPATLKEKSFLSCLVERFRCDGISYVRFCNSEQVNANQASSKLSELRQAMPVELNVDPFPVLWRPLKGFLRKVDSSVGDPS